jgi:mannose-1-phosphate guanylyltransferase
VVKENSWLSKTIVGWNSVIGRWCRVEGVTVFGENVKVRDELYVN